VYINALISRRSVLERPDNQGRLRPVAANIDLMLVVFAPEPAPQPAYSIAIWSRPNTSVPSRRWC
jgi:hypothetical protein